MIIEPFFPTMVYAKDININNNQLAKNIIEWSKQDKGVLKTNVNGWHSKAEMQTKPEYQELCQELYNMQLEIYREEWLDRKPVLGNMWANINYKGSFNRPHLHPNSLFSGVYYVQTNENSGKLKIIDPRPGRQTMMPIMKQGQPPRNYWRETYLAPIQGRIIMFPSYLWHEVEENKSDKLRISVSFNFIQEGFNV